MNPHFHPQNTPDHLKPPMVVAVDGGRLVVLMNVRVLGLATHSLFSHFMPKKIKRDGRPTDRQMDKPSHNDEGTHAKIDGDSSETHTAL